MFQVHKQISADFVQFGVRKATPNGAQQRFTLTFCDLKRIVFFLALLVCVVFPLMLGAQQLVTNQASGLTFESFIQHPPSIKNAVWEEDWPNTPMYVGAHGKFNVFGVTNRAFRLVYDGGNYSLTHIADVHSVTGLGGSGGQFGSIQWGSQYGEAGPRSTNCFVLSWDTNSDPVNYSQGQNQANGGPPLEMVNLEVQARYAARKFLCFGMFEMVPGTVVWIDPHQFIATYDEPTACKAVVTWDTNSSSYNTNLVPLHGQMTVKLIYGNEVPTEAKAELDCGISYTIKYKYSQAFAAGRLPIEFTRYFDPSQGEEGRAYTVRVSKLELPSSPIPIADFDLHKALNKKWVFVKVWAKGQEYRETKTGLVKAFTIEELAAGKSTRYGGSSMVVRESTIIFLVSSSLALAIFLILRNKSLTHTYKHK